LRFPKVSRVQLKEMQRLRKALEAEKDGFSRTPPT